MLAINTTAVAVEHGQAVRILNIIPVLSEQKKDILFRFVANRMSFVMGRSLCKWLDSTAKVQYQRDGLREAAKVAEYAETGINNNGVCTGTSRKTSALYNTVAYAGSTTVSRSRKRRDNLSC
jgi:hypothetical protein